MKQISIKMYFIRLILSFIVINIKNNFVQSTLLDLKHSLDPQTVIKSLIFNSNDSICVNYLQRLENVTEPWAKMMLASSSPTRIALEHTTYDFGYYDDCMRINSDLGGSKGKYCLVKAKVQDGLKPIKYTYSICLPSKCADQEISAIISNLTQSGIEYEVLNCQSDETRKFRIIDWIAICIFSIIAIIPIVFTFIDRFTAHGGQSFVKAFSLSRNFNELFTFVNVNGANRISSLSCMRVFSLLYVILSHSFISISPYNANPQDVNEVWDSPLYGPVIVARLSIDSFLFISGILSAISFFSAIEKHGTFDFPKAFIRRYFRFTLCLAPFVLLFASLYRYLGSGPVWYNSDGFKEEENDCQTYWWAVFLQIQNIYNTLNPCIMPSWYISLDMQIFLFSSVLFYTMHAWRRLALFWVVAIIIIMSGFSYHYAFVNYLPPLVRSYGIDKSLIVQIFANYCYPHNRMQSWLVGVILGYIITEIKRKEYHVKLRKRYIVLGWLCCISAGCFMIFVSLYFQLEKYGRTEAAMYLVFRRVIWPLALSWMVFACFFGYAGPVNDFFSWQIWIVLEKLSFSTYLTHDVVIKHRRRIIRFPQTINYVTLLYTYFDGIFIGFLCGIVLYLFVEAPVANLSNLLLNKVAILPLPQRQSKAYSISLDKIKQ